MTTTDKLNGLMGQLTQEQEKAAVRERALVLVWRHRLLELEEKERALERLYARDMARILGDLAAVDARLRALEARSTSTGGEAAHR